jgi:hypothetical protein
VVADFSGGRPRFLKPPPLPVISARLHFVIELKVPYNKKGTNNLSWVGSTNEASNLPQGVYKYIAQLIRELDGVGDRRVRYGMLSNFATTVFAKMIKCGEEYQLQLWRLDVVPPSAESGALAKPRGIDESHLLSLANAVRQFVLWGE